MKAIVVTFPGSNCDKDVGSVLKEFFHADVTYLWHKEQFSGTPDLVVLPGGFSYGDYLRTGAMARFSKAMNSVIEFANKGGKVLGICNGFQILTESGLLPGALLKNRNLKFICRDAELVPVSKFTKNISQTKPSITVPIAHGEGAYFAEPKVLDQLESEDRILFRYKQNPNGSLKDIAGISSANGNVMGLMPHPERAMNAFTGNMDGRFVFESILGR